VSADLQLYRAVAWIERAVGIGYAPTYSLHQAADVYQIPAGQLAELLLVKCIECQRARAEREAMQAADAAIDAGKTGPGLRGEDARGSRGNVGQSKRRAA